LLLVLLSTVLLLLVVVRERVGMLHLLKTGGCFRQASMTAASLPRTRFMHPSAVVSASAAAAAAVV
jgi:hypothetical protein